MKLIPALNKHFITLLMSGLIGFAWLALWLWGQSPGGRFLNHAHLAELNFEEAGFLLVYVAGWTLMTVAMMLPTTLPLIKLFYRITSRRSDRLILLYLLLVGYLSIWVLFGLLVHLGDWLLHRLVAQSPWLSTNSWLIGASILILAGIYQFTPLKYHCLEKCRSPLSFIMERWSGRDERRQSFRLGIDHGLFCLGCCWSLMLLMFGVGSGNLGWMLGLATVMVIEKNLSWGRHLSQGLGIILVIWGIYAIMTAQIII
jgi:predicted metal-binding membrane protein